MLWYGVLSVVSTLIQEATSREQHFHRQIHVNASEYLGLEVLNDLPMDTLPIHDYWRKEEKMGKSYYVLRMV
uniref:Putative secreted protein n=1 Tax=Ixodes ricinus TaxID=34613 RepID=A0A6B0TSJ7_IXORI